MKKLAATVALSAALPATALAGDAWQFSLSPYAWLAGVEGNTSTLPPLPAVPIEVSPSDALEDTETSLMLIFDAKRGRHGLLFDLIYTDVQTTEDLGEGFDLKLDATSKNTLFTLAYTYELYNESGAVLDVFAGARYWDVETILKFSGGEGPLAGRRFENTEDWIDPMFGVKGRTPLGDSRFYLIGWAGLGGFGVNSDLFYDLSLNVGYQWTDTIGTSLGYRLLDVDYDNDKFVYDIEQSGFVLGLTWRF